ncbi:hypothetical protein BD770DRAFT_399395 [Pilaira anomala]|nr:hypothetical protein BD770DRAFT_399395 [Pilaira anomala]
MYNIVYVLYIQRIHLIYAAYTIHYSNCHWLLPFNPFITIGILFTFYITHSIDLIFYLTEKT